MMSLFPWLPYVMKVHLEELKYYVQDLTLAWVSAELLCCQKKELA